MPPMITQERQKDSVGSCSEPFSMVARTNSSIWLKEICFDKRRFEARKNKQSARDSLNLLSH